MILSTAVSNGTQGFRKGHQYAQHPTCIPSPNPRSLVAAQPASNAKCNAMQVNQYIRLISKSVSFTKKCEWVVQKGVYALRDPRAPPLHEKRAPHRA